MNHPFRFALALLLLVLATRPAAAGGGPENYCLVVNRRSGASMTIANHFIALRQIPSSNVVYLEWDGDPHTTDIETFRTRILLPVLQAIQSRKLTVHIDGIVYSSDFPYNIEFAQDLPADQRSQRALAGSINGLTYLSQYVLRRQPGADGQLGYRNLFVNFYFRPIVERKETQPTHAFRSWYGWGAGGELLESGGERYLLSTMLGITAGQGNTVDEVIQSLRRSANADGTHPKGTIYYTSTKDIRSTIREPLFAPAVAALKALGVQGEVINTVMPRERADVAGLSSGTHAFDWPASGSTILPGAICENLTSYGAEMPGANKQTLLSEFIRAGAAGSSGTTVEPGAIAQKFPSPFMHIHYARGSTLAEAYYQSVQGPHQLAVVGDPLCRPWANIPQIEVEGIEPDTDVKGKVTIKPSGSVAGGSVDRFYLFVDGASVDECSAGGELELDTTKLEEGSHEVRVVGVEASPIESQGRVILQVNVANRGRQMTLTASKARATSGEKIRLKASAPAAQRILFYSNGRVLGPAAAGERGEFTVDTATLGTGPVTLRAIGLGTGDRSSHVLAKPVQIQIDPARR